MSKQLLTCLMLVTVAIAGVASSVAAPDTRGVAVTTRTAERRVDISIDGQPFTSYLYPQSFEKPVLYPIRSAAGLVVTRGYPLDPAPASVRIIRISQSLVQLWRCQRLHTGTQRDTHEPEAQDQRHRAKATHRAAGGDKSGELSINADWVIADGSVSCTNRRDSSSQGPGSPGRSHLDLTAAASRSRSTTPRKELALRARSLDSVQRRLRSSVLTANVDPKPDDNVGVTGHSIGSDGKPATACGEPRVHG
jgi:hypothetical protein